jgi:CTP:molybdopterin cytidylyltransferase MocA
MRCGSASSCRHVSRIHAVAGGDEVRVAAAVALEGGARAVRREAVDLGDQPRVGPERVDLVAAHARSRPGICVHDVRSVEWTTHRGIPVTTPAAPFDAHVAPDLRRGDAARVVPHRL